MKKSDWLMYFGVLILFIYLFTTITGAEDINECAGCSGCCCSCDCSDGESDSDNDYYCDGTTTTTTSSAGGGGSTADAVCTADANCGSGCNEGQKCVGSGSSAACTAAATQETCQNPDTADEDCRSGAGSGLNRRGVDNSCDDDADGYMDDSFLGGGRDCDDTRDDVHPGATEECDNIDHDCDGDSRKQDGVTVACTDDSCKCPSQNGVCQNSVRTCMAPVFITASNSYWSACGETTYTRHNPAYEPRETTCNDGLDNDCDGTVDTTDPDCASTEIDIS